MKKHFAFMAFAKGEGYVEKEFKKYIGIAPVSIIAVNPNKEELASIYESYEGLDPVYTTTENVEGKPVTKTMITFIAKTIAEKCNGVSALYKINFFLEKAPVIGSKSNKVQVIDSLGRTGWVTKEELKEKAIPVYSNGPADLSADYRMAMKGEEDLTLFIKTLLNIPSPRIYDNGQWVPNTKVKPEDLLCRFDNIEKIANGDVSELKSIVKSLTPNQIVKIVIGIKTTDDNKQFPYVYKRVLPPYTRKYEKIAMEITKSQNSGALKNIDFVFNDFQEYEIKPTVIASNSASKPESPAADFNPWGNNESTEAANQGSEDELPF